MKELSLAKCTFIYFISAFLFLLIKLFAQLNYFSFLGSNGSLIINGFIQLGIMFLIPAALYLILHKRKPKDILTDFQFNKISGKTVALSFAAGFIMFLCVIVVSSFAAGVLQSIGYKSPFASSSGSSGKSGIFALLILPTITSAVLPAFCEEFINRGMLQNSLYKLSPRRAIFFSALLFAMLHYNINQAVYAFFVGIVLGAITYFSKSIYPAIIMHFTNNFASTFFDYAEQSGIFGGKFNALINSVFEGSSFHVVVKFTLFAAVSFSMLSYLVFKLFQLTMANRMSSNLRAVAQTYLGDGVKTKTGVKFEGTDAQINKTYDGEVFVKLKDEVLKNVAEDLSAEKTFFEKLVPKIKGEKGGRLEKTFLYSSVFITTILTLFTLIWGLM